MKLRTLLIGIFGLVAVLLVALLVNTLEGRKKIFQLAEAEARQTESNKLAAELRQSSDDLTRMARTYVVTGENKYWQYFGRILDIRNGKAPRPAGYDGVYWDLVTENLESIPSTTTSQKLVSLEDRMIKAGFSVEEFALLKNAQNQSDSLVRLENVAMHAVNGEFDDGTGSFDIKKEPDRALAIQILHGSQYHEAKAKVMKPLDQFMDIVSKRTLADTNELNKAAAMRLRTSLILSGFILLVLIVSYLLVMKMVLQPVQELAFAVEKIGGGEYVDIAHNRGARELQSLMRTFNQMTLTLKTREDEKNLAICDLDDKALALEKEKGRAEKLLLNILPVAIAERLQRGEEIQAETFPEVTVFFADIVGFTKLAAEIGPKAVTKLLNDLFDLFDQLVDKHDLEKIKTIGDCYMAVAGVPTRSPTHAQQMADFALDVIQNLRAQNREMGRDVQIRIGIHSGTVAAGIIGRKKFAYDLWGDVVNVTSRLETTAEPMTIHASETVRSRLEESYIFEDRGDIELKNRGKLRTYYLTGRKVETD